MTINKHLQQLAKYPLTGLYECVCEPLNRATAPFRDEFTKKIVAYTRENINTKTPLVYCAYHPGGLLFDVFIFMHLLAYGYRIKTIIIIEPHHAIDPAPVQALKNWFTALHNDHTLKRLPNIRVYKRTSDYKKDCKKDKSILHNIFVSIDEDRAHAIANFSDHEFSNRFFETVNSCAQQTSLFFFLYYYDVLGYNYRHGITGTYNRTQKAWSANIKHCYGEKSLWENQATFSPSGEV